MLMSKRVHAIIYFLLGVFSESTARGLKFYSDTNPAWLQTSKYIKFILDIWKVVSVKSSFKGKVSQISTNLIYVC